MTVHTLDTGLFKLDGGAMFGVVPKSMWQKLNPPDANNMCTWAMRCLLVEDGKRLMLIDNGIGEKQDEKFRGHFYLHGDDTLEKSLRRLGYTAADITDVFLTHLHFDHCGGSVVRTAAGGLELAFPNATYWSNEAHWDWAVQPNPREKASFLKENILPIQESGHLRFVDKGNAAAVLPQFREIIFASGHTEKMMVPVLNYKGRTLAFMADLLPSAAHIPLPYVMSYDVRPLITLTEKEAVLRRAADENWVLLLEHDPTHACCTVQHSERGVRLAETFRLEDL
ncbi:Glyoxylase, beta-lactamase superfamily II [Hymenobacter daecheongensis DSM 21074]|uniref:Glyoxylase, beta-lactamase superfamily II n=1 Tax=Hymenobacter daecheongensis DSM 21074 TaxID=1121955 RepID=A0A1M6HRW3_9BACT|nr:MBL fold metallo-hydrolase [Hymenobacter daecheongensis]SHJ24936.1 Glyoxylase, beta-lactamase superfamily II [Hymenobacter daecheongensis DSM 21074]